MKVEREEKTIQNEGGDEGEADSGEKPSRKDHYLSKNENFAVLDCGMNQETGINLERGCTDFICVVFFLAFVATMFGTAFYGLVKGHPKAMLAPYDFTNSLCGVNDTVAEYPKLYFTTLAPTWSDTNLKPSPLQIAKRIFYQEAVCVKECPSAKGQKIQCPPNNAKGNYASKCNGVVSVQTTSMMDICFPHWDDLTPTEQENWRMVMAQLRKNPFFAQFANLQTAWKAIVLSMITAFILCVIYIYFMSIFAEYVAWGIIILTELAFVVLTIGGFYMYARGYEETKYLALTLGIVGAILALIFGLAVVCGYKSLTLAIEIVNCSADFLAKTKRLLAVPVLYYLFLFLFFLFWLACIISVESMGKIVPAPEGLVYIPLNKQIEWGDRKEQGYIVNWILAFLCFGLIWFVFFLQASNNYVTIVTAATYYFSSNGETDGTGSVKTGLRWAWVHNFGSLAFGSFVIAVIFTIRVCVYYLCKKAEKMSGDNALVKCVSCLVQCFLKCLEEIMEYINKAAYAFMAIAGQGFCKSAYNGLILNFKHGAKFAFGNYLAFGFILLGKIGITVLNTFLAWLFMKHVSKSAEAVTNPYFPLIFVAVVTFLMVSVFLGMFDESVLSMLTSTCADMDIHEGEPQWGPVTLHTLLEKLDLDGDGK